MAGFSPPCRSGRSIPSTAALTAKIDFNTPRWKWPFWVWTKQLRSLAVLRRVALGGLRLQRGAVLPELRRGTRRALGRSCEDAPWGVHGRLRWSDLQASPGWRPEGRRPDELVEIAMPMRTPARPASSRP